MDEHDIPVDAQVICNSRFGNRVRRCQALGSLADKLEERVAIDAGDVKVELGRRGRRVLHVKDEQPLRVLSIVGGPGRAGEPAEREGGSEGEEDGETGSEGRAPSVAEGEELLSETRQLDPPTAEAVLAIGTAA